MYNVKITNNYLYGLPMSGGGEIKSKITASFENWGNQVITIPGMGPLNFIDLGDKKIEGYTGTGYPMQTWGALIRFQMTEIYFRYEGQGSIEVTVDQYGDVQVKMVNGTALVISLMELSLVS